MNVLLFQVAQKMVLVSGNHWLVMGWDDLGLVLCEALTKPDLLCLWFPSCP